MFFSDDYDSDVIGDDDDDDDDDDFVFYIRCFLFVFIFFAFRLFVLQKLKTTMIEKHKSHDHQDVISKDVTKIASAVLVSLSPLCLSVCLSISASLHAASLKGIWYQI